MPLVKIEILEGRPAAEKKALLDAVHSALVEALKIPEHDRMQILHEHPPEAFEIPPGKTEKYTVVEVTLFPGRSLDAKRRLYQSIIRNFGAAGITPPNVFIVIHEPAMENFGVRGVPASEIDLGFEVRV